MRKIIGLLAAFLFSGSPADAQAQIVPGSAPADEYFGAHHESILGIRNRLDRLDVRADADMYTPTTMMELDDLQSALLDWQHQYPSDPWLPHFFARLLNNYQRAGGGSTPRAQEAFTHMQSAYPNAQETANCVAMGYGVAQQVHIVSNKPAVPNNAWARFDQSRVSATPPPRD
jgi:hypothetical protein